MWRLNALARTILPVPVFLKRLAAPRCVFSFGMCLLVCCLWPAGRVRLGFRRALTSGSLGQDDVHLIALLTRHRLGQRDVGQFGHQALENAPSDLRVRHFATAEEDRRFDLVTFSQESLDVLLLELVVVHIDFRSELDLLDLDHALVLLRFTGELLLLVLILAKVHDPAKRRHCGRRDLDQVEPLLTRNDQRLWRRHDPQLLSGLVDDADFANTNAFVGTNAIITSGRAIESYNVLLRRFLFGYGRRSGLIFPANLLERVRNERVERTGPQVASRTTAYRNRPFGGLAIASHQHVRDLLQLGLSDLITNLLLAVVQFDPQPGRSQTVANPAGIVLMPV